ncbi:MAG: MBOAT family protein [Candidatus Obscuribacterales bacterium]|nr:MBOAT family protein [Candidatus Obscuribacterales bacterium]
MLFTSFQYLLFLPVIVALFWLMPKTWRMPMLLAASYYFYMSWMPAFILLIIGMTLFNWLWGNLLAKAGEQKKLFFALGIAANLLCLGFFKYTNLLLDSIASGWHADIILPLGISFFTFEFIHYLFEIYRGNKPMKSLVLFALFAAFFPTQIAGPIKRYPDFQAQMLAETKLRLSHFDEGIPLIIIGMAKKLLLADNLATFVQMGLADPHVYGAPELWLFAYAFAFQIYFDFSGYTDIGRGSAMLFGYHIPINFNMPYIARNIADFWHRWHISLSTWLRDYLFIPLGGSRNGRLATHRNLFLTMALGGLWHGASWNFLVWGIYHGLALILHKEFTLWKETKVALKQALASKLGNLLSILLTFHAVCIGWVFFRVQDINQAFFIVKRMLTFSPLMTKLEAGHLLILKPELPVIVPVVIAMVAFLLAANLPVSFASERGWFRKAPAPLKAVFCTLLILCMITFMPDKNPPFIYFQF